MTTKQLNKTDLDWMDEPIKADRWVNIYFETNGHSSKGMFTYPCETSAIEAVKAFYIEAEKAGKWRRIEDGAVLPIDVLSHVIQLPVKS